MPSLCAPCDRSFSSDEALRQHLQTSRAHAPFDCDTCNRKFMTQDALEQHLKTSPVHLPSIDCKTCGLSFKSEETLQEHMQSPAHAPTFDCKSCNRSFKDDEALKQHLQSPVHDPTFPCKNCDRSFKSDEALEQHMKSPAHGPTFPCKHCGRSFKSDEALEQHMKSPAHVPTFPCKNCDRSFKSDEALEQHMKSPAHDSTLNCQTCDRKFKSKEALEDHLRDSPVHGQKSKTPLDTFFGSFRTFKYDPSLPPSTSYAKLRDHKGWGRDDPEGEDAWDRYQAALAAELNMWYGAEDDLAAWHSLCRAIGIEPPPQTCALCKKAARNTHVNIVDLIHWGRNQNRQRVRVFRDVGELRVYTRETGKIFHNPYDDDHDGGNMVLRHLLRKIFR
ncbi:unnamed protein product [Clonostachys solani]|uniref:C2H2-type domain-containing protein n=1 Tax=Clonostachys solani TaxID=160281 RepID=A0A9P0EMQ8_9HYPO|nr:unnamed protein product [Clonostachys solani]